MTQKITWGKHPDYANGKWIKLFNGTNAEHTKERRAQGFELRVMPKWLHPEKSESKVLSESDRETAFIQAVTNTQGANERWERYKKTGLTDEQLSAALRYELGIAGGSSCSDSISIAYEGSGLKIWASWQSVNHCIDLPIFEGKRTIAMARKVFCIDNPDDQQMALF